MLLEHLRAGPLPWWRPAAAVRAEASPVRPEASGPRAAFIALVAFTFVLLLAPQERYPVLGPLHLAVLTTGAAIFAHLRDRSRAGARVLARGPEAGLAIALAGWALLTVPFSLWPKGSLDLLFGVYLKSIAIFLLLGAVLDDARKLRQLAWALTFFAVPLAITAVANFAEHKFVGGGQTVERIIGYQAGLAQNPNDLALILNLILPLSVALLLSHRGPVGRAFLAGAIALDAAAVVATFSRAGFLTLAAVFAGLLWKLRRRPQMTWAWAVLGLALLAALLLPDGYLGHLETITNSGSDPTGSAQERSRDMITAAGQVLHQPLFGAGLGMNMLALNAERGATWRSVHNVYLQYAVDLGLPGLALFLLLFASCLSGLRAAVRRLRADAGRHELLHLAEGLQLSLGGFALAAFFHPVGYHFPFFYLAGLAVAVRGVALERT